MNFKMTMALAATAMSLGGCLGSAPSSTGTGSVGNSGNAAEQAASNEAAVDDSTTGAINNTFDHPANQDPFAILARIQTEGSPLTSTIMHSCSALTYTMVGTVLSQLGVNLGNTTKNSAGAIYKAGAQALGQADYGARVPNAIDLTTAGATKLFDILTEAAPEVIASAAQQPSCALAGVAQPVFAADGTCNKAGLSCIQGYPATQAQLDLCNNILSSASTPTIGQSLAVATLMAAAHTCE